MKFGRARRALSLGVATWALWAQPGIAQDMTVQAIRATTIVDIPFVLGDVDTGRAGTTLWAKGDKPANPLIASFSIRPVQVAKMDTGATGVVLWRAFAGGGITLLRADELDLAAGPQYFCGVAQGRPTLSCFIDDDANGSFDHVADALPERGTKPYHVTVLKGAQPLPTPLPYHAIADEQRPTITVELTNCAKDYDRPRFVALSTSDRNLPVSPSGFAWHAKDSSFASCRRGSQIASVPGTTAVAPSGGYIGQIGPLAFTVGPKKDPQLALVGPVDRQALYRLEGASLVNMSIGHTPNQAQLIAVKKFPYPVLMADDGAVIHDGPVSAGGKLATIPFHHAYRGKLTRDISISTLLGKRSLPAGTVVYGFPAQSRITRTVGGIPDIETVGDDEHRNVNLELTWCAPLHGAEPEKQKPGAIGRSGWSAACIPYSSLGNHTIITDMQPAFSVTGVSYDVNTSSNDGPPPIQREDDTAFERPLRLEYVYQGREGDFIALAEQVYFGEQLTSSKPVKLFAPSGNVVANVAGARVELVSEAGGDVSVRFSAAPVSGSSPILRWDQRPLMLQQLRKMGLRPAEAAGEVGGEAPVSSPE